MLDLLFVLKASAALIAVALFSSFFRKSASGKLPPGPSAWPILGHLFDMSRLHQDFHLDLFDKWRKLYGDIFRIKLGFHSVVLVVNHQLFRDAFVMKADKFSGRGGGTWLLERMFGGRGLATSVTDANPTWKEHRKLIYSVFRENGIIGGSKTGGSFIEQKAVEEVAFLRDELKRQSEQDSAGVNVRAAINKAATNTLSSVLFRRRFHYEDKKFLVIYHSIGKIFQLTGGSAALNWAPWLRFVLPSQFRKIREMDHHTALVKKEFLRPMIKQRLEEMKSDSFGEDFVATYANELGKRSSPGQGAKVSTELSWQRLEGETLELVLAGTESVTMTTSWLLLYMALNPEVFRKCQQEMEEQVGRDRLPVYADRARLPYMKATMLESARLGTVTPLTLPHRATSPASLGGYDIPEGTVVFFYLTGFHHDPTIFKDPARFNPERFLQRNSNQELEFVDSPLVKSFSVGRRACPGEAMARLEVFMLFAMVLQTFDLRLSEDSPKFSYDDRGFLRGLNGLTYTPPHFKLNLTPRGHN